MDSSLSQYSNSYGTINAYDNAQLQLGNTYIIAADNLRADYQRFVDSLFFPELHAREESIEQPSDGTFDWIFDGTNPTSQSFNSARAYYGDRSERRLARCSEFTQWLKEESVDATCLSWWVKGKAGSGKSTLMSHLCHKMYQTSLCGGLGSGQSTTLLKHFFWELGAPLQRSMLGCLRTLLWQFFASYPDRGFVFWQKHLQQRLRPSGAWTSKLLNDTFDLVITVCNAKFFVFIDGLDECADRAQLLQFLQRQQNISKLRLCVSSRPDRNLELAMGYWPTTKLEDLTEEDMRRYADTEISAAVSKAHGSTLRLSDLEELKDELVSKAEGVFIWLTIACKSLIEGIENLDSPDVLSSRLEELPADILQLYNHMLRRAENNLKRYARNAASIFNLLLHGDPDSSSYTILLAWLSWALDDSARAKMLQSNFVHHSVLSIYQQIDHERTNVWIKTHCANLIEVYCANERAITASDALLADPSVVKNFRYKTSKVRFIHKTVADFLVDTIEGQKLLKASSMTKREAQNKILEAALCDSICKYTLVSPKDNLWWWWRAPDHYLSVDSLDHHQWTLVERTITKVSPAMDVDAWLCEILWKSSVEPMTVPICPEGFLYVCNRLGHYEHIREVVLELHPLSSITLTHLLFLTVQSCVRTESWNEGWLLFFHQNPAVFDFSYHAEHVRFLLENGASLDSGLTFTSSELNRWGRQLSPLAYCFCFPDGYPVHACHNRYRTIELLLECGADPEIKLCPALLETFVVRSRFGTLDPQFSLIMAQKNPLSMISHEMNTLERPGHVNTAQQLRDRLLSDSLSPAQRKIALFHRHTWYLFSEADMLQGTVLDLSLQRSIGNLYEKRRTWDRIESALVFCPGTENSDAMKKHERQLTFPELLRYFEWEEDDIQAALVEPNFDEWRALFPERDPEIR